MLGFEKYRKFCAQNTMLAADTVKTIQAGGAGIQIVLTRAFVICLTAAAQTVYVGDTSGNQKILSLPASYPVNSEAWAILDIGLALTVGDDAVIKPAAAGPSFFCILEGFFIL